MEGEMVSAGGGTSNVPAAFDGGMTDVDGVSLRDAASPARAVGSADGDGG